MDQDHASNGVSGESPVMAAAQRGELPWFALCDLIEKSSCTLCGGSVVSGKKVSGKDRFEEIAFEEL